MNLSRLGLFFIPLIAFGMFTGCGSSGKEDVQDPTPAVQYEGSSAIFPNPERGFLRTLITHNQDAPLDQSQLNLLRGSNISIVLRFWYLDDYKASAISQAELDFIQADFDKIRSAGLKAIIRFAYTEDMNGTDASFATISQHIDQLTPYFAANQDIIAFVQAGFIGAYGEWHSSSNGLATTDNERLVLTKLLSALPASIMVQVRTPGQKQAIFNTTNPVTADIAYTSDNRARVGHHNDCFLTGGTDYGTYNNVALEKAFISSEALFVPTGGETCPPTADYDPSCVEGRNEMKLLKWTYLNLDYYPPTIAAWRASGCFDEFQSYLGYRLALVDGTYPATAPLSGSLAVKFNITNRGYAPLYHKKNAAIVLKNLTSGVFYEVPLQVDLRTVKPAATVEVNESVSLAGVPAGPYAMYLRIADEASSLKDVAAFSVRLANNNGWVEEHNGMNNLNHQLTIQ